MKRFFIEKNNIKDNLITITDIEHNHLKNVLRLNIGDEVLIVCGDSFDYFCKIIEISKNKTVCELIKKEINTKNPKTKVTVFQAIVKKDNMSLIVQKLNELGIISLIPFESEFITAKNSESKQEKLQDIANQSCKQCGRSIPLIVEKTIKFNKMLELLKEYDAVIFANETENMNPLNNIRIRGNVAIIIGSEGGFSNFEIESLKKLDNIKSVSLGNRILRAETASIMLSAIILNNLGEF